MIANQSVPPRFKTLLHTTEITTTENTLYMKALESRSKKKKKSNKDFIKNHTGGKIAKIKE